MTGDVTVGAGLSVDGVSVRFGGLQALDDVSLAASAGQVVGLIGPNGAGKTTLFNVLCGFVRPSAGTVSWEGRSLVGVRPHQLAGRGIARTLQGLGLFPHLTVLENVMVGADVRARAGLWSSMLALPRSERDEARLRERARAELRALGVAEAADRLPGELPYGLQKRVAVARALVAEPRLLLLDEPASGLSTADMTELGELIREIGSTACVLLVEHHMDLVMTVCDHIAVLDFGRVIAAGTPAEIRDDPVVVTAYLGETADDGDGAQRAGDLQGRRHA